MPPDKLEHAYRLFVRWKSRPLSDDDPQTVEEFCVKHNIDPSAIGGFIASESFSQDVLEATMEWAKMKVPELIHLVYKDIRASKSVAALERFLSLLHDLRREDRAGRSSGGNQYNFFNITDEQYARIIERENRALVQGSTEPAA